MRPFVVTVLSPEHLLAEKVRTLLVRAKPRDLYDVWLLIGQGVHLDGDLIRQKLKLYEMILTPVVVEAALTLARADWELDLRPLLGQYIEPEVTDRAEPRCCSCWRTAEGWAGISGGYSWRANWIGFSSWMWRPLAGRATRRRVRSARSMS